MRCIGPEHPDLGKNDRPGSARKMKNNALTLRQPYRLLKVNWISIIIERFLGMAVTKVEGDELRKQIQLGKKMTMSFAFCPGKKDDHVMIIDRRLKPKILQKAAKSEGSGAKAAYGTFEVSGKTMTLTCEIVVPAMERILKKYLKAEKLTMDIVILEAGGSEDDSAVEASDEKSEERPAKKTASAEDDSAPSESKTEEPDDTDADENQFTAKELVERIKALQPALAAAPDALKKVMAIAIGQIKKDALEAADKSISALEKAAAKLSQAASDDEKSEPSSEQKKEAQSDDTKQPDVRALAARASALREVVAGIAGPAGGKLGNALASAVAQIKASDYLAADTLLGKIEAAANKMMAAAKSEPKDAKGSDDDAKSDPQEAKWQAAQKQLQPLVDKMIAEKRGDLAAINRFFNYAKEQAEAGVFDKALAAAGRLAGLLKDAAAATTTAAVENAKSEIPDNVVPYVKSRLAWIKTRSDLQQELGSLQSAIKSTVAGIEGLEDVAAKTGVLFDYLDGIDTNLETTLEKLVEAPDGAAREGLKNDAMGIIDKYRTVLDGDFFKDVDNNGFVKTNIRAAALKSLDQVSQALAL